MNVAPWSTASSPCIKFATEWPEIMKLIELRFKRFYNLVNFVPTHLQILELLVTEIIPLLMGFYSQIRDTRYSINRLSYTCTLNIQKLLFFKYVKSFCISLKKINQEPLTLLTFNPLIPGDIFICLLYLGINVRNVNFKLFINLKHSYTPTETLIPLSTNSLITSPDLANSGASVTMATLVRSSP